jgi:hypothetical protein
MENLRAKYFYCDFCGVSSNKHKYIRIESRFCKFVKLIATTTDKFTVCSDECKRSVCLFLTKCDLTHGLPYMVKSAYKPNILN